jgi:hypothetical protein
MRHFSHSENYFFHSLAQRKCFVSGKQCRLLDKNYAINKNLHWWSISFPRIFFLELMRLLVECSLKTIAPAPQCCQSWLWLLFQKQICSLSLFISLFAYVFKIFKWICKMELHLQVIYFFLVSLARRILCPDT